MDDHFKFVAIEDCMKKLFKEWIGIESFKKFLSAKVFNFTMDLGAIPFLKPNAQLNRAQSDYPLKNSLRF